MEKTDGGATSPLQHGVSTKPRQIDSHSKVFRIVDDLADDKHIDKNKIIAWYEATLKRPKNIFKKC